MGSLLHPTGLSWLCLPCGSGFSSCAGLACEILTADQICWTQTGLSDKEVTHQSEMSRKQDEHSMRLPWRQSGQWSLGESVPQNVKDAVNPARERSRDVSVGRACSPSAGVVEVGGPLKPRRPTWAA